MNSEVFRVFFNHKPLNFSSTPTQGTDAMLHLRLWFRADVRLPYRIDFVSDSIEQPQWEPNPLLVDLATS